MRAPLIVLLALTALNCAHATVESTPSGAPNSSEATKETAGLHPRGLHAGAGHLAGVSVGSPEAGLRPGGLRPGTGHQMRVSTGSPEASKVAPALTHASKTAPASNSASPEEKGPVAPPSWSSFGDLSTARAKRAAKHKSESKRKSKAKRSSAVPRKAQRILAEYTRTDPSKKELRSQLQKAFMKELEGKLAAPMEKKDRRALKKEIMGVLMKALGTKPAVAFAQEVGFIDKKEKKGKEESQALVLYQKPPQGEAPPSFTATAKWEFSDKSMHSQLSTIASMASFVWIHFNLHYESKHERLSVAVEICCGSRLSYPKTIFDSPALDAICALPVSAVSPRSKQCTSSPPHFEAKNPQGTPQSQEQCDTSDLRLFKLRAIAKQVRAWAEDVKQRWKATPSTGWAAESEKRSAERLDINLRRVDTHMQDLDKWTNDSFLLVDHANEYGACDAVDDVHQRSLNSQRIINEKRAARGY